MNWKLVVGVLGMALLVGGCAETSQVKGSDVKTGVLVDSYPLLQPGKEGEANLVYMNPEARWRNYNKIMLDAVSVWLGNCLLYTSPSPRDRS